MSRVYVDATTLIALGRVGELDLLMCFDGTIAITDGVRAAATTEPEHTNVERFCERDEVVTDDVATPAEAVLDDARSVLDADHVTGDVELVAVVLDATGRGDDVGVVSDDARVRTVADGLGATVTGSVGVVVRAVEEGLDAEDGKELVRRLDEHGLHMTGELRATAERLVEEAGEET
jgi:predicted nucleic acid-binding protein